MNLRYALMLEVVAITEATESDTSPSSAKNRPIASPCAESSSIAVSFVPVEAAGVYVATGGDGVLCGENYRRRLRKGDYFLLPYRTAGNFELCASGGMTVA